MPCNCDHLEPNQREAESKEVCKHLKYVLRERGEPVPVRIEKGAADYYGDPEMLDVHLPLLCGILSGMKKAERDRIVYNGKSRRARKLADWWEKHKRIDDQRKADERKAKRDEAVRTQAIAKLTPAERRVLGL